MELVPQLEDTCPSQETLIMDEDELLTAKPRPLAKVKKDI